MSSAIYVTFDEGGGGGAENWRAFAAEHDIAHSPRTAGGNVWYAGDVEVVEEETSVTFSTYTMGSAMPEVAALARAFWLRFGGSVEAAPELRGLFAACAPRAGGWPGPVY